MQAIAPAAADKRYAKCIEVSKRIRWDIDRDVIRGRGFDLAQKFLPDGLSFAERAPFLDAADRRLLSQVQGRTYANMFGLVERFIGAKMLEITREHALGDQVAMEALVRFTDEELKHQELFRRIEALMAAVMPPGYAFGPQGNDVAQFVLGKSTWAVLASPATSRSSRRSTTGRASTPTRRCRRCSRTCCSSTGARSRSTRSSTSSSGGARTRR
jgi:hypothetical protein